MGLTTAVAITTLTLGAIKLVTWIGNGIEKVVEWWSPHKEQVNRKAYDHIIVHQNLILQADDPRRFGEILAIDKEKSELEIISQRKYKNLTDNDRRRIDSLLAKRDYY